MKSPVIYYHLWREGDWKKVNTQILERLISSGLVEKCERINICIPDQRSLDDLFLHGLPDDKVEIRRVRDTRTEWPTLELMHEEYGRQHDVPLLYLHSKGASYPEGHERREPVRSWVDGLLYYLVEDWRSCFSMMRTGAVAVGANRRDAPCPHYSGNFWWIKSEALAHLPNPKLQNQNFEHRFGAEFWIGSLGPNALRNHGLVGFGYQRIIGRQEYATKNFLDREKKNICVHIDSKFDMNAFKNSNVNHEVYIGNSYSVSYLDYIIENYETLPEVSYFVRTSQLAIHSPDIFDVVDRGIQGQFHALSRNMFDCNEVGEPQHAGLPIGRMWDAIYPDNKKPESFRFGAGAQFAATREVIQSNTVDFYINLRSLISNNLNPIEDFILERLWSYIFGPKTEEVGSNFMPEVFIFNYGPIDRAMKLWSKFNDADIKAWILDSDSGNEVPDYDFVCGFDNIYYAGLWNEAFDMFTGTHMMVVTSDVDIPDVSKLMDNAKRFFASDRAWIYAPNVNYTFWDYELSALPDYSKNVKLVPNTDGMCWLLSSDAVYSIGLVDNEINKIGFGIDLLAAMFAQREGKLVGRDYSITVKHPQTREYDSAEAERQEFAWVASLGYTQEYTQYRNHYAMSFLK